MTILNYKLESCDQFKKMKIEEFHRDYNLQIRENQKFNNVDGVYLKKFFITFNNVYL